MLRSCSYSILCVLCLGFAFGCGKKTDPTPPTESAPAASAGTASTGTAPTETDKAEAEKRLRQIIMAFFSHYDSNDYLPVGVIGTKGQFGLSWRVALLPYLGQEEAELYKQFNLKEPWDSEHNKKLIARMPKVYASPGTAAASGKTHFRSFIGPLAFIHEPKRLGMASWSKQVPGEIARGGQIPRDFPDGTSNTLAVVESPEAVEWTKPDDIPFLDTPDAKPLPVPKLGGVFPGGFHAVLADGDVFFFPDALPEKDLRALITVNAGDMFGPETLALLRAPKPKPKDAGPAPTKPSRVSTARGPTSK